MDQRYERNNNLRGRRSNSIFSRLNRYSLMQYKKHSPPYIAVSFAICLSYMMPYFSSREADSDLLWVVKLISACLCISLLLKELWNKWWTFKFHVVWHLTLFYSLAFVNPLLFIMNGGGIIYMLHMCVSVIMISFFMDRRAFICLSIIGAFLAFISASYLPGYITLDLENMFYMGYTYVVSFAVALLFLKKSVEVNKEITG